MPHRSSSSTELPERKNRKRVVKACDRCRQKKSKCDGLRPCNRCRADDCVCRYGERRRVSDRVIPKGYVEALERQDKLCKAGLAELYDRLVNGKSWPGEPLHRAVNGRPNAHDILDGLGLLDVDDDTGEREDYEEDQSELWEKYSRKGSTQMKRKHSSSSYSDYSAPSSQVSPLETPPTQASVPGTPAEALFPQPIPAAMSFGPLSTVPSKESFFPGPPFTSVPDSQSFMPQMPDFTPFVGSQSLAIDHTLFTSGPEFHGHSSAQRLKAENISHAQALTFDDPSSTFSSWPNVFPYVDPTLQPQQAVTDLKALEEVI